MWQERNPGSGVLSRVRRPRSVYIVATLLVAAALTTLTVCGPSRQTVEAETAWVNAAPAGDTAVLSMTLTNHGTQPVDVVDVLSSAARSVAIFQHFRDGDTIRTALLRRLEIPGGASSTFAPPGPHVMLAGLQRTLHEGDHVRVTVILADGHPVDVDAIVRSAAPVMVTHAAALH
jgi:periplasmic copper chaperone A